ncbi:MAG: hypothetical protein WCO98_13580 [bacterium]
MQIADNAGIDEIVSAARQLAADETALSPTEEMTRRIFAVVSSDIDRIEEAQAAGKKIEYPAIFPAGAVDKVAALLFITRRLLIDISACPAGRENEAGHADLTICIETLFNLSAHDAFTALFEFIATVPELPTSKFWKNVISHITFLLVIMPGREDATVAFVKSNQLAQRVLQSMMNTIDKSVAARIVKMMQSGTGAQHQPAPYMAVWRQLDLSTPYLPGVIIQCGVARRINRAFIRSDFKQILQWISDGNDISNRAVLIAARGKLTRDDYAALLEAVMTNDKTPPMRKAVAAMEVARLNQEARPNGGLAEFNRILFETAINSRESEAIAGRCAVHGLGLTAELVDALLMVMDEAVSVKVAEEALWSVFAMRKLSHAEKIVARRRELFSTYRRAYDRMTEINNLMSQVWETYSEDDITWCIERLRKLAAFPELEKVKELAKSCRSNKLRDILVNV